MIGLFIALFAFNSRDLLMVETRSCQLRLGSRSFRALIVDRARIEKDSLVEIRWRSPNRIVKGHFSADLISPLWALECFSYRGTVFVMANQESNLPVIQVWAFQSTSPMPIATVHLVNSDDQGNRQARFHDRQHAWNVEDPPKDADAQDYLVRTWHFDFAKRKFLAGPWRVDPNQ